jgi:hypothetical protein
MPVWRELENNAMFPNRFVDTRHEIVKNWNCSLAESPVFWLRIHNGGVP